jgi:hypothetical protein
VKNGQHENRQGMNSNCGEIWAEISIIISWKQILTRSSSIIADKNRNKR